MKYGSYPQNADFDDLPIEYEQFFFTKRPIDNLTNNIVKRLRISSTGLSLDNRIYESNHQNANFDKLTF